MSFGILGLRRLWPLLLVFVLAACGAPAATGAPPSATPLPVPSVTRVTRAPPSPTSLPSAIRVTRAPPTASSTAPASAPTATAPAGPTATPTTDPAVAVVLAYLDARIHTDINAATSLSCPAWRPQAVTEVISFRSMNARLEGAVCSVTGSAGAYTLVGCTGKMVTTYGGETRDWDLSPFVYQTLPADGKWQMCGYH